MGLIDRLFGTRKWHLYNKDAGDEIEGQFEPEDLTEGGIGSKYAEHSALNRKHPIVQFLSGESETVSFSAMLYARDSLIGSVGFTAIKHDLDKLKNWARRDEKLGRPPILTFWVGDQHVSMDSCVLETLNGIAYGRPTALGTMRSVRMSISLLKYEPFSLEDESSGETRYHRAKTRDYYEMLTYREYGDPAMGDIIRKRHPTKPNIQTADIIKLPSKDALRKDKVKPTSIILETAFDKRASPQRARRLAMLESRDRSHVSHVILE